MFLLVYHLLVHDAALIFLNHLPQFLHRFLIYAWTRVQNHEVLHNEVISEYFEVADEVILFYSMRLIKFLLKVIKTFIEL